MTIRIAAIALAISALAGPALATSVAPAPVYPPAALKERIEGSVKVQVTADAEGNVIDAKVLESNPAGVFDRQALEAAKSRRLPATGRVEKYTVVIDFKIDG